MQKGNQRWILPWTFHPLTIIILTFFFELVDITLHHENREVSIKDLNWIVKYFILHGLPLPILLLIFGIYFGMPFDKQSSIILLNNIWFLLMILHLIRFSQCLVNIISWWIVISFIHKSRHNRRDEHSEHCGLRVINHI